MSGKRFLLTLSMVLALALPAASFAQFTVYAPSDGVSLRQGYFIEYFRSGATDADGNFMAVWSDTRLGQRDLWGQLISPTGQALWAEDGLPISQAELRQEDPHVMPDGNGNWIITWVDFRDDYDVLDVGDIYIQKVDNDGNRLWTPSEGVPVVVGNEKQLWVQSFTDNNGGAVSIWPDNRSGNTDLYAQHTNSDGVVQWETNGRLVAGGVGDQGLVSSGKYTADTDGAGGIIFAWIDGRNINDNDIYANRLDANGDLVWADSLGMPLTVNPADQAGVRYAPDGNGGAFFLWIDKRNDPAGGDIWGQHVSADGSISWADGGVPLIDVAGFQGSLRVVSTAPGEAIMIWEDKRFNSINSDIFAQRITLGDGAPVLHWSLGSDDLSGMVVDSSAGEQTYARLDATGDGGAVVSWVDLAQDNDLFAQKLSPQGSLVWNSGDPVIVSDAPQSQEGNLVRMSGSNPFIIWLDYSQGSPSLFYQLFDADGNKQLADQGEQIIFGIDGNGENPEQAISSDDHAYVVWKDGRSATGTSYMQYIDLATGQPQWQDNGINVAPDVSTPMEGVAVTVNADNDAIVMWGDSRIVGKVIYSAQKVNSQGALQWGDMGIQPSYDEASGYFNQESVRLLPTADGGVIMVYVQQDVDWALMIAAQRIDANGVGQWTHADGYPGVILEDGSSGDNELQSVIRLDDNSFLIVYERNQDLFAIGLNDDGTTAFSEVTLSTQTGLQTGAIATRVDGGAVIVWEDSRRGFAYKDIYGQMIGTDGSLQWASDGAVMVAEENHQQKLAIGANGPAATDFWVAWQDARDNFDDIRVQRYDLELNPQFASTGLVLGLDDVRQIDPELVVDSNNGAYVVWREGVDQYSDLFFVHLNEQGDPADPGYPAEGAALTDAYHNQSRLSIVDNGRGGALAVWNDERSSGKQPNTNIYMQGINDYTVSAPEIAEPLAQDWKLASAWPNPFNPSTSLSFTAPRAARVQVAVYDILGRRVARLVDGQVQAGEHRVLWNGTNDAGLAVASGSYFIRLEADGRALSRRVVLMK